MMKNRKPVVLMPFFVVVVLGVVVGFFLSTRTANEGIQSGFPRIDISALQPGSFIEEKLPSSRIFVVREFNNKLHVFTVPHWSDAYWLPEFDWAHPAVACANFGPENSDGVLVEDGIFRCEFPDYGEFFRREHSWSYSGENLGYRTADLKIADYEIDQDTVILNNR
jgi:hypothetical protein